MINRRVLTVTAVLLIALIACVGVAAQAQSTETDYYVAFGNQNYAIKNANKMTLRGDEYVLEKVSLSRATDFYVTDNKGVKYYNANGENMKVSETAVLTYNIKFSPDRIYDTEENGYAATESHVTYGFYEPAVYSVGIGERNVELEYNPYFTAYERYHLSAVAISAGEKVVYGEGESAEEHEISSNGVYRILFTPTKVVNGNDYKFDADGNYGSGDDFIYNLYIEDASEYFAVIEEGFDRINAPDPTVTIDGKPAYPFERYEQNVTGEEYRLSEAFVAERDRAVKYSVYQKQIIGDYREIDDDNDADTTVSKLTATDAGWYRLSLTVLPEGYRAALEACDRNFGGFYIVGDFNGYGYNGDGGVDIDAKYGFKKIEDGDADYNADYEQYILEIAVTPQSLIDGNVEFYITDGADKYKNDNEYISLNTAGKYKILFSETHVYSAGRHYRYTLLDETSASEELEISTVEQFLEFARKCGESADYSINLSVYLTADLDFSGAEFIPVKTFGGKFNGGYHSVKNVSVSGEDDNRAVFQLVARTATIERLRVENLKIDGKDSDYCGFIARNYGAVKRVTVSGSIVGDNYSGGIAAFNGISRVDENSSTIDSNNVQQTAVIDGCKNLATVVGKSNVGGIAGFNTGDISASANEGYVRPYTELSRSNLTNIGGIAGFSAGKIVNCENKGAIGEATYGTYVGGAIGFCTGENYFVVNRGKVLGRKYIGGIIGGYGNVTQSQSDSNDLFGGLSYEAIVDKYFSSGDGNSEVVNGARHGLFYLQNFGEVEGDNYVGGVLGNCDYQNITVKDSFSTGDIKSVAGGYLGGIVANGTEITVSGCFTSGNVIASGASANYAGGIAGVASRIEYCMTEATVTGDDYVGGLAGSIVNSIESCYSNAVVVSDGTKINVGAIAGFAQSFNNSLNSFADNFRYNYYVECGVNGIKGTEYAENFNYAATAIAVDKLLSEGELSPYLHENFSHAYWQGGESNSFPVLKFMSEVDEISDIDNESELFAACSETLSLEMKNAAKLTYTVVFMEWNKDLGDLKTDGEYEYANFEPIYTVKAENGSVVNAPDLKYADKKDGQWMYSGNDAIYFVTLKNTAEIHGNTVVYAEYKEAKSTAATADGSVLVEGLFDIDTEVELVRTGEYYSLKFTLDGKEISASDYIVKFKKPTADGNYSVYKIVGGTTEKIESSVYGDYIRFASDGETFAIVENVEREFTNLELTLITTLSIFAALVLSVVGTHYFKKRKAAKQAEAAENGEDKIEHTEQ